MIIGITGHMGSGKDEAYKQLKRLGFDVVRYAFADPLKKMVKKHWKFTAKEMKEKPPKVRDALQKIGVMMREEVDSYFWINALECEINRKDTERIYSYDKHIVITDVRFFNESVFVKKNKGIIIRIDRKDNTLRKKSNGKFKNHKSEKEILLIEPNVTIANDTTKKHLRELLKLSVNIFNTRSHRETTDKSSRKKSSKFTSKKASDRPKSNRKN